MKTDPLFAALRGRFRGQDCLVLGCGPSAFEVEIPSSSGPVKSAAWIPARRAWTFACNRINRNPGLRADFCVCVEPTGDQDCWGAVESQEPIFTFSHHGKRGKRPVLVGLEGSRPLDCASWLGKPGEKPLQLGMAPFWAAGIAAFLGFERIGLLGVDLTPDRWALDLPWRLNDVEPAWARLAQLAFRSGSQILNLSPVSTLQAVPRGEIGMIRPRWET